MPLILLKKIKKQKNKNTTSKNYKKKQTTSHLDPRKTKMAVEFNDRESASIKSFAVKKKKRNETKVTTRFISGKLLMFAKLSLKSFIYILWKPSVFHRKKLLNCIKNI